MRTDQAVIRHMLFQRVLHVFPCGSFFSKSSLQSAFASPLIGSVTFSALLAVPSVGFPSGQISQMQRWKFNTNRHGTRRPEGIMKNHEGFMVYRLVTQTFQVIISYQLWRASPIQPSRPRLIFPHMSLVPAMMMRTSVGSASTWPSSAMSVDCRQRWEAWETEYIIYI